MNKIPTNAIPMIQEEIYLELPANNLELSNIGFNKKFEATIDYKVVGENETSVTLMINNITFKKRNRVE